MATTILLDDPTEIPADDLPFAREFIGVCRFTYAKSVPNSPHECCVRSWIPADRQDGYDRFVRLIKQHGYRGRFLVTTYTYLNVAAEDGESWRYWESPSYFPPGSTIINRASNVRASLLRADDPRAKHPEQKMFR